MTKLRTAHPNVSIATMKATHPFRNVPRVFDLWLKGWRLGHARGIARPRWFSD